MRHVRQAVDEELLRRGVRSSDDLRLTRGTTLLTPEGAVALRRIGSGAYTTAYRELTPPGRVFTVTTGTVADKEILERARRGALKSSPHLPEVEKIGTVDDANVYAMPFFKVPLKEGDGRRAWKDYKALSRCQESERRYFKGADWGYPLSLATIECARDTGVTDGVVKALERVVDLANEYEGDYALEFVPRNLGTDKRKNLVLLDVIFDREADTRTTRTRKKRRTK